MLTFKTAQCSKQTAEWSEQMKEKETVEKVFIYFLNAKF